MRHTEQRPRLIFTRWGKQRGVQYLAILLWILVAPATSGYAQEMDTFTPTGVLTGSTSTSERCAAAPTSLWVVEGGRGECIRYFAGVIRPGSDVAIVWLQDDVIYRLWNPDGSIGEEQVFSSYANISAEGLTKFASRVI